MSELTSEDRQRLREMAEDEWCAAAVAHDWDGCLSLCSDDFVYMPPESPALHGQEESKAFLDAFPTIVNLTQKIESIVGSTDLAVCRMSFQLTTEQDGQELSADGKGLASAVKGDGGWLFTSACFNLDTPAE